MNAFVERNSPESVPEVGKVSVNETRLSGGSDAGSRFSDLPSKVVLKIFLELLLLPEVSGDISHHDSSVADSLMPIVYLHHRVDGWLEEVLWVGVPILGLGPTGMVFGSSEEVSSSHPHQPNGYPQERHHPSDRDPEDDDEVYPKEGPALRGIR